MDGPVVTLDGGAAPPADAPPRRGGEGLLLLGAAVVAGGLALASAVPDHPVPVPAPALALRLLADGMLGSQSGVLLLPVEARASGADLELVPAAWASPVRSLPTATGARRVAEGTAERVVVLVQPDCGVVGGPLAARLDVTVSVDAAGLPAPAVLDMGADPRVQARVRALCGEPPPARVPPRR